MITQTTFGDAYDHKASRSAMKGCLIYGITVLAGKHVLTFAFHCFFRRRLLFHEMGMSETAETVLYIFFLPFPHYLLLLWLCFSTHLTLFLGSPCCSHCTVPNTNTTTMKSIVSSFQPIFPPKLDGVERQEICPS